MPATCVQFSTGIAHVSVPDLLPFLSEPEVGEFLPCTGRADRVGSTDQAVQPAEHFA